MTALRLQLLDNAGSVIYDLVNNPDNYHNDKARVEAYNEAVCFFKFALQHIKKAAGKNTTMYMGLSDSAYAFYVKIDRFIKMLAPEMEKDAYTYGIAAEVYP